jgi:uncharacterized protein YlxW (UPF0749 family)
LKKLEELLRERGVLPQLTEKAKVQASQPKEYDNKAARRILDTKRTSQLEQENIELKARVKELEAQLERFGELSEVLSEMGMVPR